MKRLVLTTLYEGVADVRMYPELKSTVDVSIDWDWLRENHYENGADQLTVIEQHIATLTPYVDEFPLLGREVEELVDLRDEILEELELE